MGAARYTPMSERQATALIRTMRGGLPLEDEAPLRAGKAAPLNMPDGRTRVSLLRRGWVRIVPGGGARMVTTKAGRDALLEALRWLNLPANVTAEVRGRLE